MIASICFIIEPIFDSEWDWEIADVEYMQYRHICNGNNHGDKAVIRYKVRYREAIELKNFVEETIQYYRKQYPHNIRIEIEYKNHNKLHNV